MRTFIPLIFLFASFITIRAEQITVVDSQDRSPVAGATVIGRSGMILGQTDATGRIEIRSHDNFPLTIRCVGYEPTEVCSSEEVINLVPGTYELSELVITPVERPVTRVVCFAREYSSGIVGADTMQLYCEYMTESFIAEGKVKGYKGIDAKPSVHAVRRFGRITMDGRDSVFRPRYDDDVATLSWFSFITSLPSDKTEAPEAIKAGAERDSVEGKYDLKFAYRKKNNLFTKTTNMLSDHKDHKWSPTLLKLLGLTVDITDASCSLSFRCNEKDSYGIEDFVSGIYNLSITGRGKWLKKMFSTKEPIEMDTYIEIYPVEMRRITVDEYKELRKEFDKIPFSHPQGIQPVSPAIATLVERINRELPIK